MLDFLRRMFKVQVEPATLTVSRDKITMWVAEERQRRQAAVAHVLKEWSSDWRRSVMECREAIRVLEEAALLNPKVPEKHKQFMEGNRREFLRRVTAFFDVLEPPVNVDDIGAFISRWNEQSATLAKGIARPAGILNEFFEAQVRGVQRGLGDLENHCKRLLQEHDAQLPATFAQLEAAVKTREELLQKRRDLAASRVALNDQLHLAQQRRTVIQQGVAMTEKSAAYKELAALRDSLIEVQDELRATKSRMVHVLAALNDALPRYSHISKHGKLVERLNATPFDMVMDDGASLLLIIAGLRHAIESGSIELKDTKRDKVLLGCSTVTHQWIDEGRATVERCRAQERTLLERIDATGIVEKLAMLRREEEAIDQNTQRVRQELQEADAALARIDIASSERTIVDAAKELGIVLTLT